MKTSPDSAPEILILAPGLGPVRGRIMAELTARGDDGTWQWLLVDRGARETLVVQMEPMPSMGWPLERATAWNLPAEFAPASERLREGTTPERVRALLGAGTGQTWRLYEEYLDWDPSEGQDDDEWQPPVVWYPAEVTSQPASLADAMAIRLGEWGWVHRVEIDEATLRPLAAATASGCHRHNGVGVLGWDAERLVAEVRFGGELVLAVGTVTVTEGEDLLEQLHQGHIDLRIVPHAGPADAERIALEVEPGLPLLNDQLNARPSIPDPGADTNPDLEPTR